MVEAQCPEMERLTFHGQKGPLGDDDLVLGVCEVVPGCGQLLLRVLFLHRRAPQLLQREHQLGLHLT